MSGVATFSGTKYQAGVLAVIYAHILKQAPLYWFEHFLDTPVAVSGETEGPGDDGRIEYGVRHPAVELQAKHGLTGGAKLAETVGVMRTRARGDAETKIVLAVDLTSSRNVRVEFAQDLERYRGGRADRLGSDLRDLITSLGDEAQFLHRVYVKTLDVDNAADAERKFATHLLEEALVDPVQAQAAWDVLANDAAQLCAKRLRRTRQDIVDLLVAKGIAVRPPTKDEAVMQQLALSRRLLAEEKGSLAFSLVGMIEADARGRDVSANVWYRIQQHRAAALLLLHRAAEALGSAQQALAIDPKGIHALLTSSHAAVELGDLAAAQDFLARALGVDANNADVWSAKVQVDAMQGVAPVAPPASLADSDAYQLGLAQIAANSGDWTEVARITRRLIAVGKRDGKILFLLAMALAVLGEQEGSAAYRAEAEAISSEALAGLADEHPFTVRFLTMRAELRRERGDNDGCGEDLDRARELNDRDPDALGRLAQAQLRSGNAAYAAQTLATKEAEEYPMLLLTRAQAYLRLNDLAHARQDLDAAVARVADAPDPDACRLYAAETAVLMKDIELAERVLDEIAKDGFAPEMRARLRGRIAFMRRDAVAMEAAFREAAERAPGLRVKFFSELAQRLLRLDADGQAVAVFDEIGLDALPPELHDDYAGALVASHDLVRAAKIVEDALTAATTPEWALRIAAEIAARRGDASGAIELLKRVAALHPDDFHITFELARRLLLMRQRDAAMPYIDALAAQGSTLDPPRKINLAHLLKEVGRGEEAITIGFSAYRAAPQDAAMHRAFWKLLLLDRQPMQHPGVVTADTYVKLRGDDGEEREYVIYSEPPIDPRSNEMLLSQAETAGYVGKRVGDVIVRSAGTWAKKRWTVEEILPAVVYVFRDIMAEYEKRFEGEPFFVRIFKMPDQPSVRDFAPIVSQLHARKTRAEAIFKIYRENTLPLGFAAEMLGVSVAEAMAGAMTADLGPLAVEWFDVEGHEASCAVARSVTVLVLTRSALETLVELELLEGVRTQFMLVAPHSLLVALERDLLDTEEKYASGQRTLSSGETGLRADEIPAGDPSLRAAADRARKIFEWTRANVRAEFRPLETIHAPSSEEERARQTIGSDSIDAVQLTQHLGAVMLADDLGLRRFVPRGGRGHSLSTVSLLPALAIRGVITANQRDRLLLRLLERRYILILPTRSLLTAALHPSLGSSAIAREAFALLGGPALDLPSAAAVAAEVLRDTALAPLYVADISHTVTLALDGMSRRWPPTMCGYALANAAAIQLALLPLQLKEVRRTITAHVKRASE
ncbi:MAG TPA: tetratricopeptide repeat protein [Thermoanaerobaculia bacterium]|nr:tetratricopeptide repeat protein [Thermoanaerobaculia bacterium]